jgi:hypothetical protein
MGRPASVVEVGGFRPTLDPFASHFGLKPIALVEEEWPLANGKPMLFVCQLNLTAAPAIPPLLAGIQLLTFFADPDASFGDANGENWQLRTYHALHGLVQNPRVGPEGSTRRRSCREEGIRVPLVAM